MYEIIDKNADLKRFCKKIKEETNIIALDTEFIRKYTYFPTLCLIQVGYINKDNEKIIKIIDPLAKNLNLTPFLTILKSKKIKKIIHSSSQDLDAFYFINRTKLNNVEDTQLMVEFCGKSNLSYTSTLNEILQLNISKNKKTQVSNWKKRPLTKKQIKYAGGDVEYLIELYEELNRKLEKNGNLELYKSELNTILKRKNIEYITDNIWKKMKFSIHKEKYSDVILIKKLAKWREQKAIEDNTIRGFILEDELLIKIAEIKPKTLKDFKNNFLSEKQILNMPRNFRNEIINLIIEHNKNYYSLQNDTIFYMKERNFPYKEILEKLTTEIDKIAENRNISASLTLTQYEMIALIMKYEHKKSILYGWKYKLFNNSINKIFKENKNILP